jgi:hypothetical protein
MTFKATTYWKLVRRPVCHSLHTAGRAGLSWVGTASDRNSSRKALAVAAAAAVVSAEEPARAGAAKLKKREVAIGPGQAVAPAEASEGTGTKGWRKRKEMGS